MNTAETPAGPGMEREQDFLTLFRALWSHRFLLLGFALVGAAIGIVNFKTKPELYAATTRVALETQAANIVDIDEVIPTLPTDSEQATVATQIQILQSNILAQEVVKHLDLVNDEELNPADQTSLRNQILDYISNFLNLPPIKLELPTPDEDVPIVQNPADQTSLKNQILDYINNLLRLPPIHSELPKPDEDVPIVQIVTDRMLSRTRATQQGKSLVIAITYTSEDPQKAALVANTITELYVAGQINEKVRATQEAGQSLTMQLNDLRDDVNLATKRLEDFRRNSGLDQGNGISILGQQLTELNSQLILAQSARSAAAAELLQLQHAAYSGSVDSLSAVVNSPLIQRLRALETDRAAVVAELSQRYGENHPKLVSARAELVDIQRQIRFGIDRVVSAAREDVAVVTQRAAALKEDLAELRQFAGQKTEDGVKLSELEREAETSRLVYENFLERLKEVEGQLDFQQPDARIVSRAFIPREPFSPNPGRAVGLPMAAVLTMGALFILVRTMLYNRIIARTAFEMRAGTPLVGFIPNTAPSKTKEVSALCQRLLASRKDGEPLTLLMATDKCNRTNIAAPMKVGRALTGMGLRTILIDCSFSDATAAGRATLPQGLYELWAGETSPVDVVGRDKTGLHILAPGSAKTNASTDPSYLVLSSGRFSEIIERTTQQYDVILIAGPDPEEAAFLILAKVNPATVLVANWRRNSERDVLRKAQALNNAGADLRGIVLTGVTARQANRIAHA